MIRLQCFVAMALGKQDTDTLYDRSLVPTLERQRVAPRRIDRLDHNDDIDDRIILELQRADFVLADLTYARPSVYFEAGFAEQRGIPVIYTCRSDHFEARHDDPLGNFRVHFDLQMKNIIPWTRPTDKAFAKKLERRVSHVTRPIIGAKRRQEVAAADEARFTALPVERRVDKILETARRRLSLLRYKGMPVDYDTMRSRYPGPPKRLWRFTDTGSFVHYHFKPLLSLYPGWIGQKVVRGALCGVSLHATSNLTKNKFETLSGAAISYPPHDIAAALRKGPVRELLEHVFLLSLQSLPLERVMSWLPCFRLERSTEELVLEDKVRLPASVLREYEELYVQGKNLFVACNPATRGRVCDVTELDPTDARAESGNYGGMIELVTVPRRVHVRVFDRLTSLKIFGESFRKALKSIESEIV